MLKVFGIVFGLAFLTFVVVQYNDPDPALWMLVYGIAALLSFMAAFGKANDTMLLVAAALYLAGGIYMWPAAFEGVSIGGGDIRNIEEARESLGLFLCVVAFVSFVLLRRFKPSARHTL